MGNPTDLVLLQDCANQLEVGMVCGLLEAHGISYVIQGENHSRLLMGHLDGGPITPRVLVAREDVERAVSLVKAAPVLDGLEGAAIADAVCPVHEAPAVATCARCGTWLCARCGTLGTPPLCEDCVGRESATLRPPLTAGQKRFRAELVLLIPAVVLVIVGLLVAAVRGA